MKPTQAKVVMVTEIKGVNGYKAYEIAGIKLTLPTPNKKVEKEIAVRLLQVYGS